jgi:polyhydroxyalkanoate synthesis regulator phasin
MPLAQDNIAVYVIDNRHTIALGSNVGNISLKNFIKSRIGIYSKDIKRYTKGKDIGEYMLLTSNAEKLIIRLVKDEELADFELKGFIDGKLKDSKYTIIKKLKLTDEKLSSGVETFKNDDNDLLYKFTAEEIDNEVKEDEEVEKVVGSLFKDDEIK